MINALNNLHGKGGVQTDAAGCFTECLTGHAPLPASRPG
jgi:hypothetical protein